MADPTEGGGSAPSAPAGAVTESAPPADTTAAPAATETASSAPAADAPTEDIWARVTGLDPDEILKHHPGLQGKLGNLAQMQAEKRAQALAAEQMSRWQAEQLDQRRQTEAANRERELLRLAEDDPEALAERLRTDHARQEAYRQQESQRQTQFDQMRAEMAGHLERELDGVMELPEIQELMASADDAVKEKLQWRKHPTFKDFFKAYSEVLVDTKASSRAEELAKARVEASLSDERARRFGTEAANGTDLGLAGVPGGRLFTREEIAAMQQTPEGREQWKKNKAAITAQYEAGLIQ